MDRDRAARPSPGAEPSRDQRRCPEQALQAARDGRDESAWSWVGEDDDDRGRAHGDKLDRLAADVDLHTRLALVGFTGPEYAEFQTELTRYGLDVMTGWLRTGKIFAKMQQAGYGLPRPPEGVLDRDAQDELAGETVTVALARFHHDVLLRRRWDPRKGARLTTFFVGQCKIRFANIYRAWLDKELPSTRLVDPADDPTLDVAAPAVDGPEWRAVARGYIRRGVRGIRDPRVHRAFELIAADHSQAEIAHDLGMSEKGVERMLANQRTRLRKLGIA
ncbi:hypothetical protein ACU61A_40905 [Pseudonocardia sichuanensis]